MRKFRAGIHVYHSIMIMMELFRCHVIVFKLERCSICDGVNTHLCMCYFNNNDCLSNECGFSIVSDIKEYLMFFVVALIIRWNRTEFGNIYAECDKTITKGDAR